MKKIPKLVLVIALICASITPFFSPRPAAADCRYFLGMPSWDCGTNEIDSTSAEENQKTLTGNIVIIASNVLTSILVASSYLVLGFIIYGGYLYIISNGESSKTAAGKKTIQHAIIGLAIVILSGIILSAIRIALGGKSLGDNCITGACYDRASAGDAIEALLGWVIGVAGLVCAIFLVLGGVGYITSTGDSSKITKAKETIKGALIGLAIVALAEIITAFASNAIKDSTNVEPSTDTGRTVHEIIISKEQNEKI